MPQILPAKSTHPNCFTLSDENGEIILGTQMVVIPFLFYQLAGIVITCKCYNCHFCKGIFDEGNFDSPTKIRKNIKIFSCPMR